jgi:hypothetical protein
MLKAKDKLERGEFQFLTKGCVAASKWQDNKPVSVLSSAHNPKEVRTVSRKNKGGSKSQVLRPVVVAKYNEVMGGVDRFDQRRERYAIGRRSLKWWHRLFYFFCRFGNHKCIPIMETEQLTFCLHLAQQLIAGFTSRK